MYNNVHMIAKFMHSLYSAVVTPIHVLSFISLEPHPFHVDIKGKFHRD
jgi:hypothetical protein